MDIIVTKRLTLRPPLEVDAEGIARGLSNWNVASRLARVPYPYNPDDAFAWIREKTQQPERCLYTVHREQVIGTVAVHMREKKPTLGYWLAEPWWGRGYATEAVRAVLARAFRAYRTDEILSYAFEDNTGSLRVMEKVGFEVTGKMNRFNVAHDAELPCVSTVLTRGRFEARFGSLDGDIAA